MIGIDDKNKQSHNHMLYIPSQSPLLYVSVLSFE